jgi:hypothetical protein
MAKQYDKSAIMTGLNHRTRRASAVMRSKIPSKVEKRRYIQAGRHQDNGLID